MLPGLLHITYPSTSTDADDPATFFSSALGTIFSDDLRNQHGDPDALITYLPSSHPAYPAIELRSADPATEVGRRKFAHYLWNAGVLMAELVAGRGRRGGSGGEDTERGEEERQEKDGGAAWWVGHEEEKLWSVKGHAVLELGAGVGLAGIMSVLAGAEEVVISDYPAPEILQNLRSNVSNNIPAHLRSKVAVEGHEWGDVTSTFPAAGAAKFTRILAADCLWMPHEHLNLVRSMLQFLSPAADARVFVIAGFHTGRARMAAFFDVAADVGLLVEDVYEMDVEGRRREWAREGDGGAEDHGERNKWLVLARLKRSSA
ncbi:hypothetical protein IWX90DRAFT_468461 [Phyllosticta citrichinensis]|uniref:Nicotinamide N-methyltransferase n=1 Tax=Phyllosticta citrichinensis TaxID=1130410 RepID=A0ABR1XGR5_9PEZI